VWKCEHCSFLEFHQDHVFCIIFKLHTVAAGAMSATLSSMFNASFFYHVPAPLNKMLALDSLAQSVLGEAK
jgi:hypothetical protein